MAKDVYGDLAYLAGELAKMGGKPWTSGHTSNSLAYIDPAKKKELSEVIERRILENPDLGSITPELMVHLIIEQDPELWRSVAEGLSLESLRNLALAAIKRVSSGADPRQMSLGEPSSSDKWNPAIIYDGDHWFPRAKAHLAELQAHLSYRESRLALKKRKLDLYAKTRIADRERLQRLIDEESRRVKEVRGWVALVGSFARTNPEIDFQTAYARRHDPKLSQKLAKARRAKRRG